MTSCFHSGTNTDTGHWRVVYRNSPGGAEGEAFSHRLPCFAAVED